MDVYLEHAAKVSDKVVNTGKDYSFKTCRISKIK